MGKEFGIRLRGIRKNAGHTTVSAAKALGVSQPTYNTWELGTREPNIGMLLELCALFDTTPNDLLGFMPPTLRDSAPPRETKIRTGDIKGNGNIVGSTINVAPPPNQHHNQHHRQRLSARGRRNEKEYNPMLLRAHHALTLRLPHARIIQKSVPWGEKT